MLTEIISSIDSPKDYLHCIAVCRRWRSIAQAPKSNPRCDLPFFHPLPLPMLLQPRGKNGKLHYFYSITKRKVNELHVPEISNKWICGSWRGWLATVDIKDMNLIYLLNPITKVTIPLPPLPLHEAINPMFKFSWHTDKIINVTSKEVAYQSSCTTVALITCGRSLHICRIGDDKWKKINTSVYRICDVIEFKGLLYFVASHAALFAIETNPITKVTLIAGSPNMVDASQYYLVESSGDLLLIARFLSCIGDKKTIGFTVYRLEEEPKGKVWKKIENLHDQVLFVGCNRTLCLDSNLYPECHGNCIYFADDSGLVDHTRVPSPLINAHDNGVYHMNDRKIEPFMEGINGRLPLPTIWFSPNPW
ncbi:F-box protein At2g26160-like [Carex rostrata]